LTPDLYTVDTSEGPTQIIVSFSANVGTIQPTDVIVVSYPAVQAPAQPIGTQ